MKSNWPKHGYSVRNVKTFRGTEGEGFNATLYRDGRRIAFVIDDASGSDIDIQWVGVRARETEEKLLLKFLKTLPKENWEDREYDVTPDIFLSELVNQALTEKRLRRLFRTETLFRLKGDRTDNDKWRVFRAPFSSTVKAQLLKTYGHDLAHILNEDYPHLNPRSSKQAP